MKKLKKKMNRKRGKIASSTKLHQKVSKK